jgi:hypothetical protein
VKSLKLDFPTGSPEGILIFSYSNIGGGGRGRGGEVGGWGEGCLIEFRGESFSQKIDSAKLSGLTTGVSYCSVESAVH